VTALVPEPNPLEGLPSMPATAEPVLVPGLLRGLGVTPHPVPAWVTDPEVIASIEAGLIDIPDDLYLITTQGDRP
jgi:hypothetical protein